MSALGQAGGVGNLDLDSKDRKLSRKKSIQVEKSELPGQSRRASWKSTCMPPLSPFRAPRSARCLGYPAAALWDTAASGLHRGTVLSHSKVTACSL